MLKEYTLSGYRVALDQAATAAWYEQAAPWGCSCDDCQHFLKLAREGVLPEFVLNTLKRLEIPAEKATYVSSLYEEERGIRCQFSYRLAGSILSVPEEGREIPDGRCCREPYPYGAPGFPEPHFDLEFWCILPF